MTSIYSESEREWLERRARKIARQQRLPLPIAMSEAMAELVRMRERPKAEVFVISSRCRRK